MLCKICGKDNPDDNKFCYNCRSDLDCELDELQYYETDDSDEGFSKEDSEYIRARVLTEEERNYSFDVKDHSSTKEIYIPSYLMNDSNEEISEEIKETCENIKTIKRRKSSLVIAFISVVVLCIFTLLVLRSFDISFLNQDRLDVYNNKDTNETFVINTSGKILHKIKSSTQVYWLSADDKSVILYSLDTKNNGTSLYYINSKSNVPLPNLISLAISSKGKLLYGTVDRKNKGELILYDTVKNVRNVLEEKAGIMYAPTCFSPNGKSYAYCVISVINNISKYQSFITINGAKVQSLGKDKIIFAISDNGKYKYYYKLNTINRLNKINNSKDNGATIEKNGEVILNTNQYFHFFNKSMTELMSNSNSEGNLFILNGKDKILMHDYSDIRGIISPKIQERGSLYSVFTGFDTFKNTVIVGSDNRLRYIDNNYQTKVLSEVTLYSIPIMSKDGKQIMFMNKKQLIKFNIPGNNSEIIADGVEEFAASNDLSDVYYFKKSDAKQVALTGKNLFYKKGDKEPVLLSSQVVDMQINNAKDTVFFIKKNKQNKNALYYSKNGKKAKEIKDINNPVSLEESNLGIFIKDENNGSSNLYYISKGTRIKLIYRFD